MPADKQVHQDDLAALTESVKKGSRSDATSATQRLIDGDADPQAVLAALVEGMDDVGRRFKANDIFVPEVLIAARAMKEAMGLLEPVLTRAGIRPAHTAVIGTVQGDLHDIGKNLVAMMWRGANFQVIDLGTNVTPDRFVQAVREHQADIVGLSALLTTTMPAMKSTVEAIRRNQMAVVLRSFRGLLQNTGLLSGGELRRPAGSRIVPKALHALLREASPPLPDGVLFDAEGLRDGAVGEAVGGEEHDPGAEHVPLCGRGRPNDALENVPLVRGQVDPRRFRTTPGRHCLSHTG